MKHIVMFSGGLGSWMTGKIVAERHGTDDLILLFADTLIEDEDLYRFLEEGAESIGGEFLRIAEGRTPWQVFFDTRFLGNSRVGNCSKILKREFIRKWIEERYKPDECVMYLGIDGMESHRHDRAANWWQPYTVVSPLCEPPFVSYGQIKEKLKEEGIRIPRLYELGFAHNNCGGFCVRSGQGQFEHLLRVMPDRYAHHEAKEKELREYLEADVAILRDRTGGTVKPLPLTEFRKRVVAKDPQLNLLEWGGCSCLVGDLED
jgi:hypothetical protein|tara:strand:- start:715 stop:1497 length:783 start_codon:yes stop_codon:yes gene_type:complete